MKRAFAWPIVISASAMILIIATFTGAPFRPAVAFWFLLLCPGMAFVRLLHIEEWLTELTLSIALSIAINTLVSETMILARLWSPEAGLVALICISLLGATCQIIDATGRRFGAEE